MLRRRPGRSQETPAPLLLFYKNVTP